MGLQIVKQLENLIGAFWGCLVPVGPIRCYDNCTKGFKRGPCQSNKNAPAKVRHNWTALVEGDDERQRSVAPHVGRDGNGGALAIVWKLLMQYPSWLGHAVHQIFLSQLRGPGRVGRRESKAPPPAGTGIELWELHHPPCRYPATYRVSS